MSDEVETKAGLSQIEEIPSAKYLFTRKGYGYNSDPIPAGHAHEHP